MKMHEFGKENKQKILLLHGTGCTYKMWTPQIEVLQNPQATTIKTPVQQKQPVIKQINHPTPKVIQKEKKNLEKNI